MSSYLGYDTELLLRLRDAMQRAAGDLAGLRCSDPDAAFAMRVVTESRSTIELTWLPFVDSLFQCRAMAGYVPTEIGRGDLIDSWLRRVAVERGWRIVTDPVVATPAVLTVDQARALGAWLSGEAEAGSGWPGGDLSDEELVWLADRLHEIATRPDLVASFIPAMTTTAWTSLCNDIGDTRRERVTAAMADGADITVAEARGWQTIDSVFVALGTIVVSDRASHPNSDASLLLTDMHAYAAALLVLHLDLDTEALVRTTLDLVARERTERALASSIDLGPRAADLLFTTILTRPGGPTAYVVAGAHDASLVFAAPADAALGGRLVQVATDPANMSTAQAALAVPALARWLADAGTTPAYRSANPDTGALLVHLVAPYLLPLLRTTPDGFHLAVSERRAIETTIMDDPQAFEHLLERRDIALGSALGSGTSSDAAARVAALRDIADLLAIVDTIGRATEIRSTERANAEWEFLWSALSSLAGLAPLTGPAAAGPGAGLAAVRKLLEANGHGPADIDEVRTRSLSGLDALTTVAASVVVRMAFDQLVHAGRVPADAEPPPVPDLDAEEVGSTYSYDLDRWLSAGNFPDDVVYEISAVKQTIASSHEATAIANEVLLDS